MADSSLANHIIDIKNEPHNDTDEFKVIDCRGILIISMEIYRKLNNMN